MDQKNSIFGVCSPCYFENMILKTILFLYYVTKEVAVEWYGAQVNSGFKPDVV